MQKKEWLMEKGSGSTAPKSISECLEIGRTAAKPAIRMTRTRRIPSHWDVDVTFANGERFVAFDLPGSQTEVIDLISEENTLRSLGYPRRSGKPLYVPLDPSRDIRGRRLLYIDVVNTVEGGRRRIDVAFVVEEDGIVFSGTLRPHAVCRRCHCGGERLRRLEKSFIADEAHSHYVCERGCVKKIVDPKFGPDGKTPLCPCC